jgi:hypothetical protein
MSVFSAESRNRLPQRQPGNTFVKAGRSAKGLALSSGKTFGSPPVGASVLSLEIGAPCSIDRGVGSYGARCRDALRVPALAFVRPARPRRVACPPVSKRVSCPGVGIRTAREAETRCVSSRRDPHPPAGRATGPSNTREVRSGAPGLTGMICDEIMRPSRCALTAGPPMSGT